MRYNITPVIETIFIMTFLAKYEIQWVSSFLSWFASLNTKLFVIYFVIHKRVFTPLWGLLTVNHFSSSNSTMAFTKSFTANRNIFCKCYCWVWRMIDSFYYSSRKIPERCENSFVQCRINYEKLCCSIC